MEALVHRGYLDREELKSREVQGAVIEAIALLDRGVVRVAEKREGAWQVKHEIMCPYLIRT